MLCGGFLMFSVDSNGRAVWPVREGPQSGCHWPQLFVRGYLQFHILARTLELEVQCAESVFPARSNWTG